MEAQLRTCIDSHNKYLRRFSFKRRKNWLELKILFIRYFRTNKRCQKLINEQTSKNIWYFIEKEIM